MRRSGLAVRLDHLVAGLLALPGVEPEGPEAEPAPQRPQEERAVRRAQPVEVVERRGSRTRLVAHRARSSASTTGSIRSTPSTRSSRFSVPGPVAERALELAVVPERVQPLGELGPQRVVDLDPVCASASGRRAASGCRTGVRARRPGARGRRPGGRRGRRSGRRSRRRARRRGAPPTAGRAGRRRPPGRRRGTRAGARRAAVPPLPSNVVASAATVSSPTRMFPCAAKHGPAQPARPVHALAAGERRAAAAARRPRRAGGGRGSSSAAVSRSTTSSRARARRAAARARPGRSAGWHTPASRPLRRRAPPTGTTEPTARNFDWVATPHCPASRSQAAIEYVATSGLASHTSARSGRARAARDR